MARCRRISPRARPGEELELRGPIGGYFVWQEALGGPAPSSFAGGSRRRPAARDPAPPLAQSASEGSCAAALLGAHRGDDLIYRDGASVSYDTVRHAPGRANTAAVIAVLVTIRGITCVDLRGVAKL